MNDRQAVEDSASEHPDGEKAKDYLFHSFSWNLLGALLLTNYVELRIYKPSKSPDTCKYIGYFVPITLKSLLG